MMKPVKILHIFGCMNRGGAEMRTLDVMRHIDRQRYNLHFCALSGLPGTLDGDIRALGGEVHLMHLGLGFSKQFRSLLREYQFDVVHSHVHYFSGYILRLAAKAGIPVRIAHFRSTADGHGSTLRRLLQRRLMQFWINRHATRIVAVSQATMEVCWPQWRKDHRCLVIYNGLHMDSFVTPPDRAGVRREFGLPPDCKLYIYLSNIKKTRNHSRLLSIFAALSKIEPENRLLLVGHGGNETEQMLRARVADLGLMDRVVFTGARSDVPRLFKAVDLMIFPSPWEGLPGSVLEACAAGTPVLASDLPVIREIASHLPLLRYLSLSDDDEQWAQAALALYAESINGNGRDRAAKLFWKSPFVIDDSARAHCRIWDSNEHAIKTD